ncbi:glycosyltransferase [Alkalibaculum bacchi]|uniref:glycosyltransferase n=1 Tax=Alkalibaculum bacchi TaxID=645887 RepID=UPI0026F0204A|nr:glycosyltransferase [Alkalibaculum bacchi]
MKILFLANAASIHTVRWVNALSERGNEVHLVYKFDDEPKENIISEKVLQYRLKYSGTKGYFLNAKQLRNVFNSIKPDVVNAHYASGYGLLARTARVKSLVLSVWGSDVYDFPYQSRLKMRIIIDNLRYANKIASTSESMAQQVRVLLRDNNKEIFITPFGVDLLRFRKTDKKQSDNIVIGNIKSLQEVYGIEYLVQAIAILKQRFEHSGHLDISKKVRVLIYGDGVLRNELELLTNKLNLHDSITFMGSIPNSEVPSALGKMDIFCATSNQESFGVSLVEAMAIGLPVVATDVSGFKEVVEDGKTGIIVKRKNPQAIAEALETLIFNSELRQKYGQNGRTKVEKLYNWEDNVNKMLEIYRAI